MSDEPDWRLIAEFLRQQRDRAMNVEVDLLVQVEMLRRRIAELERVDE